MAVRYGAGSLGVGEAEFTLLLARCAVAAVLADAGRDEPSSGYLLLLSC